ncbi:PKD domain-containing protein [Desulforhopalus sp. 52FAK]
MMNFFPCNIVTSLSYILLGLAIFPVFLCLDAQPAYTAQEGKIVPVLSLLLLDNPLNNKVPVANAGSDQTVADSDNTPGELVKLDGSASTDNDGTIVTYHWTENNIEIASGVNPSVFLSDGSHTIRLTVIDNDDFSSVDDVSITVLQPQAIQPNTLLGTNLSGVTDYDGQWDFVDVMKNSRDWITYHSAGSSPWDTGLKDQIAKDADGYPLQIPFPIAGQPDQNVRTVVINVGEHLPTATYTVLFDGDGDLSFGGIAGGAVNRVSSNRYEVTVQFGEGLWLNITRSDVADHVRNIRIITPGFEDNYATQIFHPLFLRRLEGFGVLRFMDYMRTNGSPTTSWSERTTPTSHTQNLSDGVCVEYMVELANRLNMDAWFTLPHMVNNEYVANFAQYVANNLHHNLKVYVEYSNELWNSGFSQTHWQWEAACNDPVTFTPHTSGTDWGIPGCNDGTSAHRFQAKRTAEIIDIFEQALAQDKTRVIGVIASQAANSWVGEQLLIAATDPVYNPKDIEIDVLAIAPYFGGSVANQIVTDGVVDTITSTEILQRMDVDMEGRAMVWMQNNLTIANQFGVDLVAYEGGQHLVGTGENQNNDTLTAKLTAAQSDPGMGALYEKYLNYWFANVGNVFANFSYVTRPSKYGSWGILEYQDQPIEEAPKFQAIRNIQSDLFGFEFTPEDS